MVGDGGRGGGSGSGSGTHHHYHHHHHRRRRRRRRRCQHLFLMEPCTMQTNKESWDTVSSCLNEYIAVATFFFANAHVQKSCYMLYMLCNVLIGGMTKLC